MTTQNTAVQDILLSNVSRKLIPEGFIAEKILPVALVKLSSSKIGYYGKEHLRIEEDIVGGRTPYPQVTSTVRNSNSYQITKHGLSDVITEEDFANVQKPFDARVDTTTDLQTKLQLGKEKALADTLTSTSVITQNTTLSGTDQWSDYTNSDPIGDTETARNTILTNSGVLPNKAVMDWLVFSKLRYHPDIIEFVKYTSNVVKGLNLQQMADFLQVQELLIGMVPYVTTKEGQADTLGRVWGKHLVYLHAPKVASKRQVSLGYRVQQNAPRRVFRQKLGDPPNSEKVLVDDSYQQLIVDVTAAYLVEDCIA